MIDPINPEVYAPANNAHNQHCGGVLLDEIGLSPMMDEVVIGVEGSRSGEQDNHAVLDERYISDNGAFSFYSSMVDCLQQMETSLSFLL